MTEPAHLAAVRTSYDAGDVCLRPTEAYGHPVSYESYLVPADRLAELLTHAGFTVTTRLEQPHPARADRSYVCLQAYV